MADIRITPASSVMSFTSSLNYIEKITQDASGSLNLYGSGSTGRTEILSVDGNNGRLFTVSDDLSDSLFSVNTIAGLPVIEAFADNSVNIGQYSAPPIKVTGSLANITGSLFGTASYATAAGRVTITNQDTTPVNYYLTFVGATSGNQTLSVDSTTLTYYPSTGTFTSPNINVSTVVRGGDGSAADPTYQFGADTNNGMYRITTDTIGFSTGGSERVRITAAGAMGLGVAPTNTAGRFEASNDIVAFSSSDKNWKKNIVNIDYPLEKIAQINGVEFDWIEDEPVHGNKGHDVGVIAQEIEQILPQAVQTRESGMKAVQYDKIIPLLIEAIKDQQKQIEELKQIVNGITK